MPKSRSTKTSSGRCGTFSTKLRRQKKRKKSMGACDVNRQASGAHTPFAMWTLDNLKGFHQLSVLSMVRLIMHDHVFPSNSCPASLNCARHSGHVAYCCVQPHVAPTHGFIAVGASHHGHFAYCCVQPHVAPTHEFIAVGASHHGHFAYCRMQPLCGSVCDAITHGARVGTGEFVE